MTRRSMCPSRFENEKKTDECQKAKKSFPITRFHSQRPVCAAAASAAPSICPTIPTHCQYLLVHLSTHEFSPTFRSPSLYFLSMHFSWHPETILE
jgi:hypothetical protein